MLLRMGLLLRLGPNVITDGTFITLGSNQSNHYTCAFYSCKGCTDLESFSATSAVRYKIANLAFAEMLKGSEVKNIVTATGGVSDYIPGQDLFVYRQDGIISGHQCRCLIENPFSRKMFFFTNLLVYDKISNTKCEITYRSENISHQVVLFLGR